MIWLSAEHGQHLATFAEPVHAFLSPTAGFDGKYADVTTDIAFLEQLTAALSAGGCYESSSRDFDLMPFIVPPGEDMPSNEQATLARVDARLAEVSELLGELDLDAETDDEADGLSKDDPKLVMLGMHADEIEEAEEDDGETWWEERWDEDEYRARLRAGELMTSFLRDVGFDEESVEEGWSVRFYSGRSPSGALLGVLGVRYDAD